MDYLTFAITGIYFYAPAALANVGANLGKFIPFFKDIKQPIDFGKKVDGIRIIGNHKNIGGFAFGVLFGTIFGIIKTILIDQHMGKYLLLNESWGKLILLYFVMSFAALAGDLAKSIAKRLLKRPAHSPWVPFDQIDHSLVSMLVAKLLFPISWSMFFFVIISGIFLHAISNVLGYWMKIKDVPY